MRCAGTIAIGDNPYCLICALMSNQSNQHTILTLMCICKGQMRQDEVIQICQQLQLTLLSNVKKN